MSQSVHTTGLLRKDFSRIPGKQILNLELLVGGLWCIFLTSPSLPTIHSQLVAASSFWTISSLEKQKKGSEMAEKIPFSVHLLLSSVWCCGCHCPGTWSGSGLGWTSWEEDQPSLTWHWRFTISIYHLLSQNTFFSFKTQNRCPVLGDYEDSFHAISSWSVWHTRQGPYRGESFANGGWNRKSTVASWKIKAKTHR